MVTMSSCCPNSPRYGCTLLRQSHCAVWNWPDAPGYLCHSEMLLYKYLYSLQAAKKWEEKQQLQDFFFFCCCILGTVKISVLSGIASVAPVTLKLTLACKKPLQFWDLPHYYLITQGQFMGKLPKIYKFR